MKGSYVGLILIVLLIAGGGYYTFHKTYMERVVGTGTSSDSESTTLPEESLSTYTLDDQGKLVRFKYPDDFIVTSKGGEGYSTAWQNNATTSGLLFVSAILPADYQPQTNFRSGMVTVGASADPDAVRTCAVGGNISEPSTTVLLHDVPFTRIHSKDAGAGNLYETVSYRTTRNSRCYTIEYTIHSVNIQNYPADTVIREFDRENVVQALESVVQSVTFSN